MRSILYVAAALMIGASIYGFVDYSKTKDSKEFAGMYNEKEAATPAVTEEIKLTSDVIPASKKDELMAVKNERTKYEEVNNEGGVIKKIVSKFKKKKKVNYESFSRAPLREEIIVETPEVKTTTKRKQ